MLHLGEYRGYFYCTMHFSEIFHVRVVLFLAFLIQSPRIGFSAPTQWCYRSLTSFVHDFDVNIFQSCVTPVRHYFIFGMSLVLGLCMVYDSRLLSYILRGSPLCIFACTLLCFFSCYVYISQMLTSGFFFLVCGVR